MRARRARLEEESEEPPGSAGGGRVGTRASRRHRHCWKDMSLTTREHLQYAAAEWDCGRGRRPRDAVQGRPLPCKCPYSTASKYHRHRQCRYHARESSPPARRLAHNFPCMSPILTFSLSAGLSEIVGLPRTSSTSPSVLPAHNCRAGRREASLVSTQNISGGCADP